jgi:hypothetical protein
MRSQVDIEFDAHDEDSLGQLRMEEDDKSVQESIDWKLVSSSWPLRP